MLTPGVTPEWLHGMFSRIAPRYDRTNTIISAGLDGVWRRRLAAQAARYAPEVVLDVACGTGGVLRHLARTCPGARLVGVDYTEAMLRVGHTRLRAHLCVGDALALPYPDACYDVVTMMFGVRNFDDPALGLAECARVLRPNGHLCVVEFTWPQAPLMQQLYNVYWRYLLPLIAWPLCGERTAYRYLRDSVLAFRAQMDLTTLCQRVGLQEVIATPLSGGITTLYDARKP